MSQKKLALVLAWAKASAELKAAKDVEAEAKAAAVAACFPKLEDGVNTVTLPGGYIFKATHYPYYDLDDAKTKTAIAALEKLGKVGKLLVGQLFKFRVELRIGAYKKLAADHKAIVAPAVTIKPAAPKLELVEPT